MENEIEARSLSLGSSRSRSKKPTSSKLQVRFRFTIHDIDQNSELTGTEHEHGRSGLRKEQRGKVERLKMKVKEGKGEIQRRKVER
jgi:hypothetical protein